MASSSSSSSAAAAAVPPAPAVASQPPAPTSPSDPAPAPASSSSSPVPAAAAGAGGGAGGWTLFQKALAAIEQPPLTRSKPPLIHLTHIYTNIGTSQMKPPSVHYLGRLLLQVLLLVFLPKNLLAFDPSPPPPPSAAPPPPSRHPATINRRQHTASTAASLAAGLLLTTTSSLSLAPPLPANAHSIDYNAFKRKIFNTPPGVLSYPEWMQGEWQVASKFINADFPSSNSQASPPVPKESIISDATLPGFRRLSIAMVPDVGKPQMDFRMRFVKTESEGGGSRVEEDKAFNLKQAIESEVGKAAVTSVDYTPEKNPNRLSLNLLPNATPNARRIELFFNARSALPAVAAAGEAAGSSFRYHEDMRQVNITPQLAEGTTFIGDYRHLWEFYRVPDDENTLRAYLSTVAYATPQDPLFQKAGLQPLVVYFHILRLQRVI